MAALLDFYRRRFGDAVKQQGSGWNGPCPLCGGEPGKSDRFMVWPERDENLGQTCTRHHIAGVWSCRQCGQHGDTIAYLMEAEGLTFREACGELRIENEQPRNRGRSAPQEPRRASEFTPRITEGPSAKWSAYAEKIVAEAAERIFVEPDALRWLALRGLDEDAVRRYRLGYLPGEGNKPGRYRHRSALGLAPKTGDDGRVRDKIFIPRGIVVPTLNTAGTVINLRIRRHKGDLTERSPKYLELEGSGKAPLLLRADGPAQLAAYFVTEAELDAMLIHHVSGGVVGALAVRTNRGKPDAVAHARLQDAARVCIALDYDPPGAEGVEWWLQTYATARRWPTPEGKDPGDAVKLGVEMREWIAAGVPACVALPGLEETERQDPTSCGAGRQDDADPRSASAAGTTLPASESECPTGRGAERHGSGQVDFCAAGSVFLGGRGNPQHLLAVGGVEGRAPEQIPTSNKNGQESRTAATPGLFTDAERSILQAAMPSWMMLVDVPEDVARTCLLWQGLPVTFTRDGKGGWGWECDGEWRGRHPERYDGLVAFVNASSIAWEWLCTHAALTVTSKNLLHYFA